jgi:hypothetical protein
MASVFVLLEAFNRKGAAALGFFPCATASFCQKSAFIGLRQAINALRQPDLMLLHVTVNGTSA